MFSTVDRGLANLIHDRFSCTLFTLSSVSSSACLFHAWSRKVSSGVEANSVVVTICIVGASLAGCVHSSVNKPGTNGRVSYDSFTHSIVEMGINSRS